MTQNELYAKFANLLIQMVGLRKGQCLVIKTEPIHYEIASVIIECAYRFGAKYCKIDFDFPGLVKSRVTFSEDDYLHYYPKSEEDTHSEYINEGWATIFLKGEEDPELLSELSVEKRGIVTQKYFDSIAHYQAARLNDEIPWLIVVLPTPKWASRVLNVHPDENAVLQMWEKLVPIYKLDEDNPAESWRIQANRLSTICQHLNRYSFRNICFKGPGTDLLLTFAENSRWITTESKSAAGATYYGNLPVEVFTTPDYRKTEGIVSITRPVCVLDKTVVNARFEFKNGEVVSYEADEGKDALTELFKIDPTTKYLGEAALIDINSPNNKSGLIFYNILLDEGASSHIALGGGIPPCFINGPKLNKEEKIANGINVSGFHIDFMIGSEEIDVFGKTNANETVAIMEKGVFTGQFN